MDARKQFLCECVLKSAEGGIVGLSAAVSAVEAWEYIENYCKVDLSKLELVVNPKKIKKETTEPKVTA